MIASIDIKIYMDDYLILDLPLRLFDDSAAIPQTLKLCYHKQIYITIIN